MFRKCSSYYCYNEKENQNVFFKVCPSEPKLEKMITRESQKMAKKLDNEIKMRSSGETTSGIRLGIYRPGKPVSLFHLNDLQLWLISIYKNSHFITKFTHYIKQAFFQVSR